MKTGGSTRTFESSQSPSLASKRRNWRRSERILVAVNLTEEGGELLTWTLTHSSRLGDTVTVIHVVQPCPSLESRAQVENWEQQKKDMLNALSELVTYCRTKCDIPHLSIVVQVLESQSIGDAIVREAQNLEATRVILGKRRSGPLGLSSKKMTHFGRLCERNLEPYCDVVIVRKGKVLIRRPGKARFRRSLEMMILSTKKQELYDTFEKTNSSLQSLPKSSCAQPYSRSRLGLRISPLLSESSDSALTTKVLSSSLSLPSLGNGGSCGLPDHFTAKGTNCSRDSSFCSSTGLSSGEKEDSPISVLRVPNRGKIEKGFVPYHLVSLLDASKRGKIDTIDKIDKGFLSSHLSTILRDPSSFTTSTQAEWLKGAGGQAPHLRSRSSSNSLESVPELSENWKSSEATAKADRAVVEISDSQVEDRTAEDEKQKIALVCLSAPPEHDDRQDWEDVDPLALPCCTPRQSESRKEEHDLLRREQDVVELADDITRESEDREVVEHQGDEGDRGEEEKEGAIRCLANCSPPKLAKFCSGITYNLCEAGLQSLSQDIKMGLPEVRIFKYEELRAATDDFARRNVVGTGGASAVYRAQLADGSVVAVKKLVDDMSGEKDFMMETMMLICTLNHPNLITMIGFCAEGTHRLLAYKLLSRGTLERNLHRVFSSRNLNWVQRHKVAFGSARGLAYLHDFRPNPIVHRDIKTSNILLGRDFEPQISDFGLARWLTDLDTTNDDVSCAGTFGYMAPECLMYGGFNERTDVFAFGVVLLELISGRRPMDESLPEMEQSLVLWARTLQQNGKTHYLVDPTLKDINPQQFKRMMYTAFLCVQVSPEDRPTMNRVVKLLDPDCSYSPAILQPNISAPPFMSMPDMSRQLSGEPSTMPPPRLKRSL